jgi:hypothetical protein
MNNRIQELLEQAISDVDYIRHDPVIDQELSEMFIPDFFAERFAELLLRNLSEELFDIAKRSRQAGDKSWCDGMNHAAMLAQRMTMNLPQWPEAE